MQAKAVPPYMYNCPEWQRGQCNWSNGNNAGTDPTEKSTRKNQDQKETQEKQDHTPLAQADKHTTDRAEGASRSASQAALHRHNTTPAPTGPTVEPPGSANGHQSVPHH